MRRSACLAGSLALLASVGGAPAAAVQCRLCGAPSSLTKEQKAAQPVAIEVETSLDFDRLILLGAAGGSARLAPDGSRMTSGSVSALTGRAMVGSVIIRGEPNRAVRIDLPARIELWGLNGGRISIETIEADLPAAPRLDSNGRLSFRFGGELQLAGEAEGDFRGDVPITVEYL